MYMMGALGSGLSRLTVDFRCACWVFCPRLGYVWRCSLERGFVSVVAGGVPWGLCRWKTVLPWGGANHVVIVLRLVWGLKGGKDVLEGAFASVG